MMKLIASSHSLNKALSESAMSNDNLSSKYFEGKPCVKCASITRYVESHRCVSCACAWQQKWRKANPEKKRNQCRSWCQANPEKHRVKSRRWCHANLEKSRMRNQNWRKNNYEKCLESNRTSQIKTRAKRMKAEGSHTTQEWIDLKEQYGNQCLRCGRHQSKLNRVLEQDHVIPLSKKGTNWITNIQPLCHKCNGMGGKGTDSTDYRSSNSI